MKTNIVEALRAIAEGYRVEGRYDRYIIVENPNFNPGEPLAHDPFYVIDVKQFALEVLQSK